MGSDYEINSFNQHIPMKHSTITITLTVMHSNMREYLASKTYLSHCYVGMVLLCWALLFETTILTKNKT